jgi:serine/threonine protein kinase
LTSYIYYAKVLQKYDYMWELTGEEVAIKAIPWQCIRRSQNRLSEDVIKEVAALQYMSNWHETEKAEICDTHILTAAVVMSNETHLYIIMPYCAAGDLCQRVAESEETRLTEDESRFWFRQILKVREVIHVVRFIVRGLSSSRRWIPAAWRHSVFRTLIQAPKFFG